MRDGSFAELLRDHRQAANLTQEELAERSGLSVQAISMLERGVRSAPRTSTVEYLAGALALDAAGRAALVAAARHRSAAPAELPRPVADHVGRSDALAELVAVLAGAGRGGRVAAIGGMGGIGKTSLAVRAASDASDHFPDGMIYVDLKGADADPLLPETVLTFLLRTLGVQESDIPADVDRRGALLRTTTATRRQLFVLDNARDAAQVRPLLPGNDDCGVLVTSRDRLAGLAGAHHVTLHPLDEPDSWTLLAAVVGTARLDAEPDAVIDLIARCAGHPLALRIAGCRLAARPGHTVRSLVDRLARTPALHADLTAGDLAVLPVLESSFRRLLDAGLDDEQTAARAFRLWGVWPGGEIALPAVCALLDRPRRDAERALDHLLDGHLLESPHTDAYRMHDLLLSYAQERAGADLPETERAAVLERLAGWYVYAADRAVAEFASYFRRLPLDDVPAPSELPEFSTAAEALEWCDVERANLLAVVHRAADAGLDRMAWRLATMLLPFFEQRMLWPEWVDSHTVARASARRAGDEAGEARATGGLAAAYRRAGDPERAIAVAFEALDLLRRRGDHERAATALDTIARAQHDLGRLPEAMATFEAIGDDERVSAFRRATSLCHLGVIRHETGAADAIDILRRALRIAREGAEPHAEIPALEALGSAYADRGEWAAATGTLTECLERSRAVSDRIHESEALWDLGRVAVGTGDPGTARSHLTASLELMTALGHPDEPVVRTELDALAGDNLVEAVGSAPEPPQ